MTTDARKITMVVSLLTSVVMVVGKVTAYAMTHSTVILSDAAESVVHGAATGLAAFSLWYAERPADADHPYGHGRIAYFSAGSEGALVFAASLAVIGSGIYGLIYGQNLERLPLGMAISAGLALINLGLGVALVTVGRRHNALILVANGKHVLSDMWTTTAVILGVGLVVLTGIEWLDPVAAILIGIWIMFTGVSLMRRAVGGLMDELDADLSNRLLDALRQAVQRGQIGDFHQLRCRKINDEVWIDVHVLVPGDARIDDAHQRVTRVENAIRERLAPTRIHITSHIEPLDHESAHSGGHADADPLLPDAPTAEPRD
jgi:cation diffusion facilitator family transporter